MLSSKATSLRRYYCTFARNVSNIYQLYTLIRALSFWWNYTTLGRSYTLCPKKWPHFYFLNSSVKNKPIWTIFGKQNPDEILHNNIVSEPVHHTWKMSPMYFVKCRKYHIQQQQQLECSESMKSRLFLHQRKKCQLKLHCELTKLSNIHGSRKQKAWHVC